MAGKDLDIGSLGFELGQAVAYAESVNRGTKYYACATIHKRNADTITRHLSKIELPRVYTRVTPTAADGWVVLDIVCDSRLFALIDELQVQKSGTLRHLYLGLLFGYDIVSVLDFIDKRKQDYD